MKPNILIIHTDQQRYDSLGCSGNDFALTPNIDKLAETGTFFPRHIAANPICMPSRASLLTGLYPPAHGVYTNGIPLNRKEYASQTAIDHEVFKEPQTMADIFAAAGYDTASFGKLHLTPTMSGPDVPYQESRARHESGDLDSWHGPYYGFNYVDMTEGHGECPCLHGHYSNWLKKQHPETYKKVKDCEGQNNCPQESQPDIYPSPVPFEQSCTAWLANRFNCYITSQRIKDKPFFSFIGFPDPHHPFTPSYDIIEKFVNDAVKASGDINRKGIKDNPVLSVYNRNIENETHRELIHRHTKAMVYQIDIAVGRIIETLKENGLWENTIIVFTSDHGDFLGDHGLVYKAQTGIDSLLHVPFILRAPGANLPEEIDVPMSNCDVLPTLTALAGVKLSQRVHGKNIFETTTGDNEHYAFAFCSDGNAENVNYTVYDKYFRFTWFPYNNHRELFDHRTDAEESDNLALDAPHQEHCRKYLRLIKDAIAESYNPIVGRICPW